MKQFSCLSLRTVGFTIAGIDIGLALGTLMLCSYYLYNDIVENVNWPQDEVQIKTAFSNFISGLVDYLLVHNFSNAFYMILAITIWIKALINIAVASVLIDGIRKQRLLCIAPWLINTGISMFMEAAVFVFMELKIDEVDNIDANMDRRIVRAVVFGIFLILNALFTFGIYALFKMMKIVTNENNALQESIQETSGLFQHVKV